MDKNTFTLLRTLIVLNLFDSVFTMFWLCKGYAEEFNPIINYFYCNFGLISMFFAKMSMIVCFSLILVHLSKKNEKFVHKGMNICNVFYMFICCYHIMGIFFVYC